MPFFSCRHCFFVVSFNAELPIPDGMNGVAAAILGGSAAQWNREAQTGFRSPPSIRKTAFAS